MENDNDGMAITDQAKCHSIPRGSPRVTIVVLGLAVLSCLLGYFVLTEMLPHESKTLRVVVILFRHGARTPLFAYEGDPHKNHEWPDGFASLTNEGKLEMYELGKKYRRHYANFIPEEYYDKDVYVRSSDKSRCLMSAYTFLAGLFPPSERQMWHPEITWQPIPVHSLPRHLDNIIAGTKPCKEWKAMHLEQREIVDKKFPELIEYLNKYTNQTIRNVVDVSYLYNNLKTEQEAGLKLPDWTKNVFPNEMRTPFMLSLALLSYNETLQRFYIGKLLGEVKNNFNDKVRRTNMESQRILNLYSGHDATVISLWRALGYDELLEPEYGASIVLELHEDAELNTFFVKAFYRNNTKVEVPIELKLPFCEDRCLYDQFEQHLNKFVPNDWEAECKNIPSRI